MAEFDVFIAGAGPAGCATAISLSDVAPDLRICLAGVAGEESYRIGETVPPLIRPVLEHLGLWPEFNADGHSESYRTLSAWASAQLASNEFLPQRYQVGWQIDRVNFEAMMRAAAAERVTAQVDAKVTHLAHDKGHWRIVCGADRSIHAARFVVDATGRAAALSRLQGVKPYKPDKLVGCFMYFKRRADHSEGLLVESFSDGWWYTAALPGGRCVVVCMSDADLVRELGLAQTENWRHALGQTRHVCGGLLEKEPLGSLILRPAASQYVPNPIDTSVPLLSVGDAVCSFDPLSSQGIFNALRSGIFASYAIADYIHRHDDRGLHRYRSLMARSFKTYLQTLADFYALEQRWPDNLFWRRRHARPAN